MTDDRPPSPEGSTASWVRRIGRSLAGAPRNTDEILALLEEACLLYTSDAADE